MNIEKLRRESGAKAVDWFFRGASGLGAMHPAARPERYGIEVLRDIAYQDAPGRAGLLDVWRPRDVTGPTPTVLYIHGGGFRILSKETHWSMALSFARRGFTVFNINYRLAPQHPFPGALQDACAAWLWVQANAAHYGADPQNLVIAGESAGGNLTLALTLATCVRRPEPFAQAVFDAGAVPRAIVPMCGMLQVSDVARFARKGKGSRLLHDRFEEVSSSYLPAHLIGLPEAELADPLCWLEQGLPTDRPLPPTIATVGTADMLLDDSRRLHKVLQSRGVDSEVHYFARQVHAFQAFVFTQAAKEAWQAQFRFLQRVLQKDSP